MCTVHTSHVSHTLRVLHVFRTMHSLLVLHNLPSPASLDISLLFNSETLPPLFIFTRKIVLCSFVHFLKFLFDMLLLSSLPLLPLFLSDIHFLFVQVIPTHLSYFFLFFCSLLLSSFFQFYSVSTSYIDSLIFIFTFSLFFVPFSPSSFTICLSLTLPSSTFTLNSF